MTIQRWTLVVVCAATAMLMLDIAVVNTALSRIAEDLNTGLSGLQWVVDAYTLALASTVLTAGALADRLGRRRVFTFGLVLFTRRLARLRPRPGHHDAQLRPRGAGHRRGGHVRRLARPARPRVPGRSRARRRAGRLRRHDRRVVRRRPARRRPAHQRARLAVDLPREPADRRCSACGSRAATSRSRATRTRARIDWPGQITLTAGLFLLVLALLRGNEQGWTSAAIVAELVGAAVALVAFVIIESRVREPMLPLKLFRNPSFTGAQIAAFSISASFFARVPLHDAVPAADPRAVGDRGRPRLPAGHDRDAVRLRRHRAARAKVPARTMISRRPRRWSASA